MHMIVSAFKYVSSNYVGMRAVGEGFGFSLKVTFLRFLLFIQAHLTISMAASTKY